MLKLSQMYIHFKQVRIISITKFLFYIGETMAENQKPKKLLLKIPVYLSEMKEYDTGTLFDLKEQDIIDKLKRDINTYNEQNSNLCQF